MNCARVYLLIVLIGSVYGICPDDCPQNKLTFLYESFPCTPQCSPNSQDDCPTEYKCDDLNAQANSCYYNGHFYNFDEKIQNSLAWERCLSCTCKNMTEKSPSFICYYGDCQWFPVTKGCRRNEKLGDCCYDSEVCPPFQTCTIDSQKYMQGEKFDHPSKKCTRCYCGEGKGTMGALRCEKQYCLDLLLYQTEIKGNCAPLYEISDLCCPSTWICPEDVIGYEEGHGTETAEDLIRYEEGHGIVTGPQCTFGTKKLNKGDKFFYSGIWGKATCECIIPPYASCISTQED